MSQPAPIPNDPRPIWELVIEDMQARDRLGRERYGVPLQAGNGRDALRDAYEESLDKTAYLKQAIIERDAVPSPPPRCERSWIQTFTGRQFWPLNPHADDICIEDIAHALANKCRYTGHTREFYSVAQHATIASYHCPDAKWALMHDASEAYLPDVARPVKRMLKGFREIEDHLLEVIATKYGLSWPMPECVHEIDLQMLAVERRDLMATPPIPWVSTAGVKILDIGIEPAEPYSAKRNFLKRFYELFTLDVEGV